MAASTSFQNLTASWDIHGRDKLGYRVNVSELESHLSGKNFKRIASKIDLFWLAFCKIFAQKNVNSDRFKVKVCQGIISIEGEEGRLKEISQTVEIFREFFAKTYDADKPYTIVKIKIYQDIWGFQLPYYYFHEQHNKVLLPDVHPSSDSRFNSPELFDNCVLPVLSSLAEKMDLDFTIANDQPQIVIPPIAPALMGLYKSSYPPEKSITCDALQFRNRESFQ